MKSFLLLPFLLAASALAQQAVVSGAPRATGGTYLQDSALASDAGAVATSASYSNRSGYAGQLYDVTALTLAATPTSVNEGAGTQLGAGATLDDGTLLVPAAGEVAWSVVSGPVTAVAADGTAAAGAVYQDTAATVQGAYRGFTATLSVTVLNLTADDFGPYAGDGLPDNWQVANFGEGTASAAPALDPDGDGQSNLLEFLAGTNPNQVGSRFAVRVDAVVVQPTQKTIVFSPAVAGRTYRVLASDDLSSTSWTDISGPLTGTGELAFTDTGATGARRFYRVQLSNP